MGVVQHETCREEAPHNGQIPIKAHYLLELNPRTSRGRLLVVSIIFFGIPVLLAIALSIFDVLALALLIGTLIEVVFSPILLVQFLEPLSTHQMLSCTALLSVMFISAQEILVVFVVLQAVSDPLLLLLQGIPHLTAAASRFPIFPEFIGLLVVEISPRRISKDQLVVPGTLFCVPQYRVSLSDLLKQVLNSVIESLVIIPLMTPCPPPRVHPGDISWLSI